MYMHIGEWRRIVAETPPQTPVFFYLPETTGEETDVYCDGVRVELSRYWDWQRGWLPCVLVTLRMEV